jgi:hypothetical protein
MQRPLISFHGVYAETFTNFTIFQSKPFGNFATSIGKFPQQIEM